VDHEVKEFKGGYDEWVAWKERMARQEKLASQEASAGSKKTGAVNKEQRPQKQNENRGPVVVQPVKGQPVNKEAKKELQKQQRIFQQLEEQIAQLKSKQQELESALATPGTYNDRSKFTETETAYKKATEDLKRLNSDYEKVFEKIMSLEEKSGS